MTHTAEPLTLVSHHLCPYVQRAAIALAEKDVAFERRWVDLSNKPDWFLDISPLGKVPLLQVGDGADAAVLFESAVILEYLEETTDRPLHPSAPLDRARHRSWMEFGSTVLNGIARLYTAKTDADFDAACAELHDRFAALEAELSASGNRPYFAGERFSLVDAVFAPVFRYFDTFEDRAGLNLLAPFEHTAAWRTALAQRPSVIGAIDSGYPDRLADFVIARGSRLSRMMTPQAA